jgi:hypothetical protein
MHSFREVIAQWPSAAELAYDLNFQPGIGPLKVRAWKRRDNIPPEYWDQLVDAAKRRRIRITVKLLAKIAASKRATDADRSNECGKHHLARGAA